MKGICKKCGDFDTIFGSWNFVHHPKNCQDLHSFIETKNDVFRKETLHLKKFLKEQRIKGEFPNVFLSITFSDRF